ncbi:MAG TPA: flagellar basal body rod protein FlgC [bacterium]|nr:flagellar basal body rod protein FlgC [bacterium]
MGALSGFSTSFAITASALTAEKLRMDVISNNIANADTTRTVEGGPYIRQRVVFAPRIDATPLFAPMLANATAQGMPVGVRVTGIIKDPSPPRMVYDPGHPDANSEGYVAYPNVNAVNEMVDLISASRAYEANITAFNATKSMALQALSIGK